MFGIKIIKESEYWRMMELVERHTKSHNATDAQIEKLKRDCESLRQQLNDKISELVKCQDQNSNYLREVKSLREFRRDTLEAMGQIDLAGFQLSYCTKKCKHCDNEGHDCKKYQFGNHQYCVIPK
jgi:chromosome segregation ATPase